MDLANSYNLATPRSCTNLTLQLHECKHTHTYRHLLTVYTSSDDLKRKQYRSTIKLVRGYFNGNDMLHEAQILCTVDSCCHL